MKIKKSFQLAFNILMHGKLRSWLTIIGIVIGIAAVVSIVSITQGAEANLEEQLGGLGADILTVTPGYSVAKGSSGGFGGGMGRDLKDTSSNDDEQENLTSRDILSLTTVDNIDCVMGKVSEKGTIEYLTKSATSTINGVETENWKEITTEELESGRYLINSDTYSVVIGGNIVTNTFEDGIPLNSKIVIEDKTFKVVGILDSGSTIYMPIEIARIILDDVGDKEFDSISVKINDIDISNETVNEITETLLNSRGILSETDQDFTVTDPSEMQETIQETMNTMTLFLTAIAAISLLVGAVGIANTMFTSVLEKTKDIGIMKAIGTQNKDILLIFLFNSGLIGFVGGLGGVILGIFGSNLVSSMSDTGGMAGKMFGSTTITPELLIGALLFSVIVGMIAGVIPAYNASKMKPVDALRYE